MPGALEDVPDRVPDVPMSVVGRNSVQVDRAMIFAHRFGSDQNMWRVVTPAAPASAIPVIAHQVLPAVNCARGSFDGIVVLGQHLETVFPDDLKQLQCGAARPLRAGFPLLHCRFPGVQVSRAAQVIVALPLAVILLPARGRFRHTR